METLTPQQISDKVLELAEYFNQYVFTAPEILDHIPDQAMLVFLDADDPEFNRANIESARAMPRAQNHPLVYITMHKRVRMIQQVEWQPEVAASPLVV